MHSSLRSIRFASLVASALAFCLAPPTVLAQDAGDGAEITGVIVDRRTGDPVPGAAIRVVLLVGGADAWSGESDQDGAFRTPRLPLGAYMLEIEGAPLLPLSEPIALSAPGISDVRVEMVAVDYQLDPVVAVGTRLDRLARGGFYERMAGNRGYFITRDDIVASRARETSDLLRSAPGVVVASANDATGFDTSNVYMRRAPTSLGGSGAPTGTPSGSRIGGANGFLDVDEENVRPGCTPLLILDGAITEMSPPTGINQVVHPSTLEAIEVYTAADAPIRYAGLTDCGVLMLWTRTPGGASGGRLLPSWRQAAVSLGITVLAIFATQ